MFDLASTFEPFVDFLDYWWGVLNIAERFFERHCEFFVPEDQVRSEGSENLPFLFQCMPIQGKLRVFQL